MRILHFLLGRCNPDSANGVEKTVFSLSRAQAASGSAVALFSVSAKPALPISGVTVQLYAPSRIPFRLHSSLLSDVRAFRPDVVHFHSAYVPVNVALGRALRRFEVPHVVTPNGGLASALLWRDPHLKVPYSYLCERPFLNRSAFVHSVGDTADIRRFGVTVPLVFAPNGFDMSALPPSPRP
jgi:hypothetical protein